MTADGTSTGTRTSVFVLAVPKGRILDEIAPTLETSGIRPDPALFDDSSRVLRFKTDRSDLDIVRVRSFDVATYVAFGAAQIGIAGSDVIDEFGYSEIYSPSIWVSRAVVSSWPSLPCCCRPTIQRVGATCALRRSIRAARAAISPNAACMRSAWS